MTSLTASISSKLLTIAREHPDALAQASHFGRVLERCNSLKPDGSPNKAACDDDGSLVRHLFRDYESADDLLRAALTEAFAPFRDKTPPPFDELLDLGGDCDHGCELDAA